MTIQQIREIEVPAEWPGQTRPTPGWLQVTPHTFRSREEAERFLGEVGDGWAEYSSAVVGFTEEGRYRVSPKKGELGTILNGERCQTRSPLVSRALRDTGDGGWAGWTYALSFEPTRPHSDAVPVLTFEEEYVTTERGKMKYRTCWHQEVEGARQRHDGVAVWRPLVSVFEGWRGVDLKKGGR